MSLSQLAAWALALRPSACPTDVLELARAQHLALAGTLRRAEATHSVFPRDPTGRTAALLFTNFDDVLMGGRVSVGALPLGWSLAAGTLGDLLAATVASNEVGARVGLATLLSHDPGRASLRAARVGAAVMRARLLGHSPAQLHSALAAAVTAPARFDLADLVTPEGATRTAADLLEASERGAEELEALLPGEPVATGALGAAGEVWLTRTLTIAQFPGTVWNSVALDALDVILQRHMKAGEKRLRADQVERIEVRAAFGPAESEAVALSLAGSGRAAWCLADAMGLLVARHEFGVEHLDPAGRGDKGAEVEEVSSRVEVIHDARLTVRESRAVAASVGPVLATAGRRALLRAGLRHMGIPSASSLWPTLQERPWSALAALQPAPLASAHLGPFAFPVEVKLYTTRGGWWPERRSVPSGSGDAAPAAAVRRFGAEAAAPLLAAPLDRPASGWLSELLG